MLLTLIRSCRLLLLLVPSVLVQSSLIIRHTKEKNMPEHSSTQTETSFKDSFQEEVTRQFTEPLEISNLLRISRGLNEELKRALKPKEIFMVPCYHYRMPDGDQHCTLVTVDIGGSVLRIAQVELVPRGEAEQPARILRKRVWPMDSSVKAVPADKFFQWVASKIKETALTKDSLENDPDELSLAWSFPVECDPSTIEGAQLHD